MWTAGRSRAGRPIRCLEIPGGPLQALLVGLPHPEEPVGALMLQYLLPLLAAGLAEELGFGFSVVMAGDPDGVVLNEPWFDRPYDLAEYLLHVYRPPLADQFEWTFPVEYKRYGFLRPLPEARAVMEVVHRRPLDLYDGPARLHVLRRLLLRLRDRRGAARPTSPPPWRRRALPRALRRTRGAVPADTVAPASSRPSLSPTTTTTTRPTAPIRPRS